MSVWPSDPLRACAGPSGRRPERFSRLSRSNRALMHGPSRWCSLRSPRWGRTKRYPGSLGANPACRARPPYGHIAEEIVQWARLAGQRGTDLPLTDEPPADFAGFLSESEALRAEPPLAMAIRAARCCIPGATLSTRRYDGRQRGLPRHLARATARAAGPLLDRLLGGDRRCRLSTALRSSQDRMQGGRRPVQAGRGRGRTSAPRDLALLYADRECCASHRLRRRQPSNATRRPRVSCPRLSRLIPINEPRDRHGAVALDATRSARTYVPLSVMRVLCRRARDAVCRRGRSDVSRGTGRRCCRRR